MVKVDLEAMEKCFAFIKYFCAQTSITSLIRYLVI